MNQDEQSLIANLATRLQQGASNLQKDSEADGLIQTTIANQSNALYLLVQMALIQEHALQRAQQQIAQLQQQLQSNQTANANKNSSFLGRIFGSSAAPMQAPVQPQQPMYNSQPAYAQQPHAPSFLQNVATTAVGVAGGAFLFEGLSNLFGGSHASSLGGFGPTAGQAMPTETIVNNYYEEPAQDPMQTAGGDDSSSNWSDDNNFADNSDFGGDDFGGGGWDS